MPSNNIAALLERINAIHDPTDLDLLLFFFRHPHVLLTAEHLATKVGHDRDRVNAAVEAFIVAGLIERTNNRGLAPHSFALRSTEDAVMALLRIASSRTGRLAILDALGKRKA